MIAGLLVAALLLADGPGGNKASAVIGPPLPRRAAHLGWTLLERPLFAEMGPAAGNVFQGELNDCALLARMANLAEQHPDWLTHAMLELPGNRVQVTLHPRIERRCG